MLLEQKRGTLVLNYSNVHRLNLYFFLSFCFFFRSTGKEKWLWTDSKSLKMYSARIFSETQLLARRHLLLINMVTMESMGPRSLAANANKTFSIQQLFICEKS